LKLQRTRVAPWLGWIDGVLAVGAIAVALWLSDRELVAGLLITLGTIVLASVILIEPATTSSAGLAD
jgi:hypothetical protein